MRGQVDEAMRTVKLSVQRCLTAVRRVAVPAVGNY